MLPPFPDLPAVLVSPECAVALEAVAARFTAPAGILIECPLAGHEAAADLSLSFTRRASGRNARLLSMDWPAGAAWLGVRRFVDAWPEPAFAGVRSLWLEFDVRRREAAPLPNPFFGNNDGLPSRAMIRAGLDLLLEPDAAERRLASACLDSLPAGARVVFAGVMLARQPAAIRFCVDGPPWFDAPSDLMARARHVIVQVDAGTPHTERVGYELYQGRRSRGRADVWRALLEHLLDHGAARADRCAAALAWPGYAAAGPHVLARWINHVKVTCEGGAIVDAKIYLQFAPAWEPVPSDAPGLGG